MIKGISFLRPAGSAAAYERLASFFAALGFAPGHGWQEETSRGASFLAPIGNLEFVYGEMPQTSDVCIEVTALDAVHQAVAAWFRSQGIEPSGRLSEITDTHWKARLFTAEPEAGHALTFWTWSDPQKGKPVAVEGDLSAEGMRFAIVVARWNAVITERLLPRRAPWPIAPKQPKPALAWTRSSPSAACCAERPPTTRPSITRWRAASGSRSRRPAFRTASAC
jgi:6,7-dimethyl-8-ribityllumazine synthase